MIKKLVSFAGVFMTVLFINTLAVAGTVDLQPIANDAIAIAVTVLTVIAGVVSRFVVSWFSSKTKMNDTAFEALAADRVHAILNGAIEYAEAWAKLQVNDPNSSITKVRIDNLFVEMAVKYAVNSMSGENSLIKLFGLTDERLKAIIISKLNGRIKVAEPEPTGTSVQVVEK